MTGDAANKPLRLRVRQDLIEESHVYQGRASVVVKDPVALKYFRFEPEEFAILNMLDGATSALAIKRRFERDFAPQRLTIAELHQFVGMMHRSGLLISDSPGQGIELWKRQKKREGQTRKQTLMNVLAFRFRGFDPDAILTRLNAWVGGFFSLPALALAMALIVAALSLLTTHFELFQSKLPHFQDFFAGKNWFLLALVLGVTKVFHEFGHGLACKRFGGQCHEMGVMLLVFTPCLYCNVSDSWMLPSKWKRIAVSAAGMYIELVLASLATFVWWYSEPGLVNQLALNVMFVCSVTTLLFNANPLMRYDGYYILSDLVEIPNLRQKATTLVNASVTHWLFGIQGRPDPFLPTRRRWLFILFSVASVIYRWVITFSIFWFLYKVLEPYGFKVVGQFLALVSIFGLVIGPVVAIKKFFSVPGRWATVNRTRLAISTMVFLGVVGGVLYIPLPHYVNCGCFLQPAQTGAVYVSVSGVIQEIHVTPGQRVVAGQPLLTLSSPDLNYRVQTIDRELKLAKVSYDSISYASKFDDDSARDVKPALATLEAARNNLLQRQRDLEKLVIRAPCSGVFLPAPPRARKPETAGRLAQWSGLAVDSKNIGATLERQTLLGQVIEDQSEMQAVLTVDQKDIEFITPEQNVKIWIRQLPGETFQSQVKLISPTKMQVVPKQLASRFGGDLVTQQDADGNDQPASATYEVSVPLKVVSTQVLDGATGIAKVHVGSQTIGYRLWRLLCQTFRFEL